MDPDPHFLGSWIRTRICIKVVSRIRIRIQVKSRIRIKVRRVSFWSIGGSSSWEKWVLGSGSRSNWKLGIIFLIGQTWILVHHLTINHGVWSGRFENKELECLFRRYILRLQHASITAAVALFVVLTAALATASFVVVQVGFATKFIKDLFRVLPTTNFCVQPLFYRHFRLLLNILGGFQGELPRNLLSSYFVLCQQQIFC